MSENLNVEHFRNGDIIPEAKTNEEWEKAGKNKRPAWCYLFNKKSNGGKFGKLYNWYVVSDPRGLAPEGWHVPKDAEWTVLTDYLEANGHDGKALKSTSGWNDFNGESGSGTDNYGWNGLPGGFRSKHGGYFANVGSNGLWWSSSQSNTYTAWFRSLDNDGNVSSYANDKKNGFSVRCLRD